MKQQPEILDALNESTESQCNMIRAHLNEGKSITPMGALTLFNCFRLGARIHNLRTEGMEIETEMVAKGDKRFAKYSLKTNY